MKIFAEFKKTASDYRGSNGKIEDALAISDEAMAQMKVNRVIPTCENFGKAYETVKMFHIPTKNIVQFVERERKTVPEPNSTEAKLRMQLNLLLNRVSELEAIVEGNAEPAQEKEPEPMDSDSISKAEKLFNTAEKAYLEFLNAEQIKGNREEDTVKRFPNNIKILRACCKYYSKSCTFDNFTEDFGSKLIIYLKTVHYNYVRGKKGFGLGGLHNTVKQISTFLNWSYNQKPNYNKLLEFKKWKVEKTKAHRQFLYEHQLLELFNFPLMKGLNYDITRDIWCFLAFTGMRWSDYKAHKTNCTIYEDRIEYVSVKANKECCAPITPEIRMLLEKYNYDLPMRCDVTVNANIKKVLEYMGYDSVMINRRTNYKNKKEMETKPLSECITVHSARRTAIMNAVTNGYTITELSALTGNEEKSLLHYFQSDKANLMKRASEVIKRKQVEKESKLTLVA